MSKPQYFKIEKFIDEVIKDMKLGDAPAPTMLALREAIEAKLSDRILATVINGMEERELILFETMLTDHPELDEIDALMVLAPQIHGLKEKMERNINSLYSELTYDAEQIGKNLAAVKA